MKVDHSNNNIDTDVDSGAAAATTGSSSEKGFVTASESTPFSSPDYDGVEQENGGICGGGSSCRNDSLNGNDEDEYTLRWRSVNLTMVGDEHHAEKRNPEV